MDKTLVCDFCGQPGDRNRKDQHNFGMDEDGLWVCNGCKGRLVSQPVGDPGDDGEMDEEIQVLVGKNAGAICRTLELPYEPPYQSIIDAASKIAYDEDRYMSTWGSETSYLGHVLYLEIPESIETKSIISLVDLLIHLVDGAEERDEIV